MKTDSIFYRLFQAFPSIFFELIQIPQTQAQNYRFDSVEVKQLSFRMDGLFLPNESNLPIYFCEVQFQSDNDFYGRFFAEIFLYLSKTDLNNDWRGVVIYPNRRVESRNQERYQDLLTSGRVSRIYLDELENSNPESLGIATIKLIIAQESQAIATARELIERVRSQIPQPQNLLQLIETILVYKLPRLSCQEIEAMFSLDELKQTR
jgi:predicted transposase/invertase (TIGR01784 family)